MPGFGSILFGDGGVRAMLRFILHAMFVFEEELFDVAGH